MPTNLEKGNPRADESPVCVSTRTGWQPRKFSNRGTLEPAREASTIKDKP